MSKKKISELPVFNGNAAEYVIVGYDTTDMTTKKCNFATLIANSGDPRIKPLTAENLEVGDMLFFDRAEEKYCIVKKAAIAAVLADYNQTRYETNYDTYIGTFNGVAHFVALDDAVASNALYSDDVAATSCFYRIEIDNTQAGSITLSATSGNASVAETTITWGAGDTMSSIVAQFTALNTTYITFAALDDQSGVGLEIGGYGANTLTTSGLSNCTVIDCSGLAMLSSHNSTAVVGSTYVPGNAYTFIGQGVHHNFRGASANSILGATVKAPNAVCIANDGFNYSARTGINFAKFKSWASVSGDDTYYDDGEGGQDDSVGHVMRESRFNTEVRDYTGSDAHRLGMKDYYTHLLNDQSGEYAELREEFISRYGNMTSMYDGYLMAHCMDVAAASGTTNELRNYGMTQTAAKADCLNVNYNYKFIPAYPPEYNAQHYGVTSEGFVPGKYYHPEPGDIGLMFRDDIMPVINDNITEVRAALLQNVGTPLTNSLYRGSCADYPGLNSWCFFGLLGCFIYSTRSDGRFRCRPVLALSLS